MITIQITVEEREAGLVQIGSRLSDLKQQAIEAKDFDRIQELTEFIKPIQSLWDKLLKSEDKR